VVPLVYSDASSSPLEQFVAKAVAMLGGTEIDYAVFFEDFNRMSYVTATDKSQPVNGEVVNGNSFDWSSQNHVGWGAILDGMRQRTHYPTEKWGGLTSRRWLIGAQVQVAAGDAADSTLFIEMRARRPADSGYTVLGGCSVFIRAGDFGVYYQHGAGNRQGGSLATGNDGTLGTVTARTTHYLWLRSMGDGTFQAALDSGAWSTGVAFNPTDAAQAGDHVYAQISAGGSIYADVKWWGVAARM
jgi:hypothetical protein